MGLVGVSLLPAGSGSDSKSLKSDECCHSRYFGKSRSYIHPLVSSSGEMGDGKRTTSRNRYGRRGNFDCRFSIMVFIYLIEFDSEYMTSKERTEVF
jgi:hypothetical protein